MGWCASVLICKRERCKNGDRKDERESEKDKMNTKTELEKYSDEHTYRQLNGASFQDREREEKRCERLTHSEVERETQT